MPQPEPLQSGQVGHDGQISPVRRAAQMRRHRARARRPPSERMPDNPCPQSCMYAWAVWTNRACPRVQDTSSRCRKHTRQAARSRATSTGDGECSEHACGRSTCGSNLILAPRRSSHGRPAACRAAALAAYQACAPSRARCGAGGNRVASFGPCCVNVGGVCLPCVTVLVSAHQAWMWYVFVGACALIITRKNVFTIARFDARRFSCTFYTR